jgi:Spy/CpxP family protein refolding chaperone
MVRMKVMACVLAGLVGTAAIAAPPILRTAAQAEHGRWLNGPLGQLISGHIGRLMVLHSELNLTDQQKDKIKEVVAAKKPEIAKVAKGVWERRSVLVDAVLADQPDERAIRKAADDLGKAIGDAAVLASNVAREVKPALNSQQRELMQKCRADCRQATAKFFEKATTAE